MGVTIKKVYLATNGCPENRNDLARMQMYLEQQDYIQTDILKEADLVLFNSCGLTNHSEDVSINIVKHLKAKKKDSAELVVYGCLSKINKARLREVYDGITFGSDEIEEIFKVITPQKSRKRVYANYLQPHYTTLMSNRWKLKNCISSINFKDLQNKFLAILQKRYTSAMNVFHPYSFVIKVSTGCLGSCSFCAVKLSRGKVKSKSIRMIANEFDEGLQKGFREFSLIGTDLGSYGLDRKSNLVELLKELTSRTEKYEIRLRNIQPKYLISMMPELKAILETGKISFISTSAESGNNRILKRMSRGYTIEEYIMVISFLNENFPQIKIRNQLMVGFPGETEREFEDSVNLIDKLNIDMTEVFMYSPRPGTRAAVMEDQVPTKIAERRHNLLLRKSVLNKWAYKRKVVERQNELLQTLHPNPMLPKYRKTLQH